MEIKYLVIEGNIGSGKTTLSKMISGDYNATLVLEQFAENPFLEKFYTDHDKYAFPLEMAFLAERYRQLNSELQNRDLFTNFTIADYYFMKSLIFASVTLKDAEYVLYRQFFDIIYARLPRPDLYVYLHQSVPKLIENISRRGREYEKSIDAEYLDKITSAYFQFFKQQTDFPVLIIETTNLNFVNNSGDYRRLCIEIFEKTYPIGITRKVL